jgi:uncharacterized membrane protein
MSEDARRTSGRSRPWARVDGPGGESGQITLLSIAFGMLALLLVTVVVSATGVHLERKELLMLADGVALAAADSLDVDAFYQGRAHAPNESGVVHLTDDGVRAAVERHLAGHPDVTGALDGLLVEVAETPDGRTARVTLSAVARPALVSWATSPWSDGLRIRVTSSARAW